MKKKIIITCALLTFIVGFLVIFTNRKDVRSFSQWDKLYGGKMFNVPIWDVLGKVKFESIKEKNSWVVTNISGENKYTFNLSEAQANHIPQKDQTIEFSGKVMYLGSGGFIYEVEEFKLLP